MIGSRLRRVVAPARQAVPLLGRMSQQAGVAAGRLARAAGLPTRGVWSRPGRRHIEVRGVSQVGSEALARRVERMLERLPGVDWARVNSPTGRVVVAVSEPEPRLGELIAAVAAAERARGLDLDPDAAHPHPPEEGPRTVRAVSALAADAFGLGLSIATRILPFTRMPGEVPGIAGVVDYHPRLHALFGELLNGQQRADSVLPVIEALVQGLAGGWAGITLDAAKRLLEWSEARAQQSAWTNAEARLIAAPEDAAAAPVPDERPRPKPDGPVERYSARILDLAAVAAAAALPFVGRKRASALGLAALPKPAGAGREAFGACLGRILARRGVVAMDRGVLRQLDRIDTLVLDAAVLDSQRATLTDLRPEPGADPEEIAARAFDLFDADRPEAIRRQDGWTLGPLDRIAPGQTARDAGGQPMGGLLLGLATDAGLQAVLKVTPEPARGLDALVAAAHRSGLRIIVAGDEQHRFGFAHARMPGGNRLNASVRTLQADGAVVMLVSRNRRALGAADCGIGVCLPDRPPPWGAHLLVDRELYEAALVVDAVGTGRTVAEHSLAFAGAGTALGALVALTAPPHRLPGATYTAINTASGLAFAEGAWRAWRLKPPLRMPTSGAPWHMVPAETVLTRLSSDRAGLSTDEARRRSTGHAGGGNDGWGLVDALADELANPLTPILAAGTGLSAVVGSPVDAGLVGGLVGLSALVGAVQRVRTERSLADLLSRSAVTAKVRRDGAERRLPAEELVPGDIIMVEPGDVIPADCRVLDADGLETDESSLTGESLPVAKTSRPVIAAAVGDRASMLYEGTTVATGRGLAVVVATGADTEVGRGMAVAGQSPPRTGVEARLSRLTRLTVPVAAGSAVAVSGAGLLRNVPLNQTIAGAANLAIASVPEGLPFLVGAAQLAAARRLAEHGVLVRNPRTIEALGRVDVLCFDKTGTLTEGRLRLVGVGDTDRYAKVDALADALRPVLTAALRATPAAEDPEQLDHQTDRAVLAGARRAGVASDGTGGWRQVAELPFEPSRGYHAAVGQEGDVVLLCVKGAPETILPRCSRVRTAQGELPLDPRARERLKHRLADHAGAGHRVLAVAQRRLARPVDETPPSDDDVAELMFVGFLTIADVVRESAVPAVRRIRDAGVHTIMITGDHPATAEAIAATIDSEDDGRRVVTGAELDDLDDDRLVELLAHTDVLARCTPAHKVRIIQLLQRSGRTVAMTGDGANDAPAIRLADVGIALGRRGTPAARAAADLVVTDDRLETIIAALEEGRALWSSVRNALSILVGGNIGEIAFSILTAAATGRTALNGRQLLLVNLLTDLVPAMSIAVRRPRAHDGRALLGEGPDAALGEGLARDITLRATSTTLGASAAWTAARFTGRRRRADTIALAALVGTQLGQTVLAGGGRPTTVAASVGSAALLAGIIQTPGLSHFFGCTPLGPVGWGIATGSAMGATLANVALKRLSTLHRPPGSPEVSG
ncbi:MAG TPA: cation-translocating P-type ATPase [Micromonosporaceae bacterium]